MSEQILFLNMFSDYEPPESLKEALSQAALVAADIDPVQHRVDVAIHSETYIPQGKLNLVCDEIARAYGLRKLNLSATFPEHQLHCMDADELRDLFVAQDSMARGALAGAQWSWEDNRLTVQLKANGVKQLEKCVPAVRSYIRERFGVDISVSILCGEELSGDALLSAMENMRSAALSGLPKNAVQSDKKEQKPQESDAIFGKPFKGKISAMNEISLDMGTLIVQGKVISIEHKELTKRNAWVINFDITDNTSAVRVSRFLENKDAKPVVETLKKGSVVQVQGRLQVDNFTNEIVLKPFAIQPGQMPKRMDTAEGEKRVELHLHTRMSMMDALTNTEAVIKQAAAWGHKAIAITDHGCVQSFTDALHAVDGKKGVKIAGTDTPIKVLYGCEGYYINDVDDRIAVQGSGNMSFDEEYVAFDLETTGLYARRDRIIEIGAVRMKNGQEIDRFQTFVDPQMPLEKRTTELTGITDEMLYGAPKLEEAMADFVKFIGDRVLVAHNAQFDTTFIRHACKKLGIPYTFTSVDTLTISQNLMPKLQRFSLDMVAKHFALPDFNHHRAADDALTCGAVMGKLIEKLQEMGVQDVQSINDAMLPLRPEFRRNHPTSMRCQHIVLFAMNQLGLRNLYQLISEANLLHFKKFPRIFKSELTKLREGILVGSACENNELFQAVIDGRDEEELERIAAFYDYLEVQPIDNNRFMLTPKKEGEEPIAGSEEELCQYNRDIVRLGEKLGKLVVATGDVHFLNPEDEIYRHILLASKGFPDADKPNPLYFRSTDEMLQEFSYLGAEKAYEVVVTNPNLIADRCETIRPVPHNLFAPSIENSVEDLKSLVYGKMHRLYGENPPELIVKRVETELNDIINCHYDVIYMSAQKLVQNSLENGYLVGSRGSVGSSIVAYMSGITEVNSFPPHYRCPNENCKYTTFDVPKGFECGADLPDAVCPKCGTSFAKEGFNIPFETFLGFGGDKVPDIDLNFSGEYQARAHAYCTEMFGKSHVFRAGTVGTVADKTAFGYVKKYLEERGRSVSKAEESRLINGCMDVRQTTGQHPGGLVVIPQENEIWDFCPVQHPADDPDSDQITTHFEYHSMEENLLKLDMLGHDDPTMIRKMEDLTGVVATEIPLDDKDTMSIFTSSKVLGYENDPILGPTGAVAVPEFNTRFTREVLLDTKPTKFDFLVRISGYTHGTDVWLGNAKDLIVSGTARVDQTIGCRDDIMIYLISCGLPEKRAFKIMESVRKGRGLPDGAEQEMIDAGVPDWYIGSCKKIKYLFPKAHAVAYVMMAFRIAWFKVNHPLAFYSAYFYRRSQKGNFDSVLMTGGLEQVKANIKAIESIEKPSAKDKNLLITLEVAYEYFLRGFEFLPIDIYKSDSKEFIVEDGKLRPPFVAVGGLGENAAEDIVKGRAGKQFMSIEEFSIACPKVSKTHIQMLKDAGAFGSLPETNQISLF